MKKLIIVTLITTCAALCAAVWPHNNATEQTPVASELQLSTGQVPAKNSAPEPTPPHPPEELQPGDKVYVAGFGWLEYEGPNHCEDGTDIYENGNKTGIMG